MLRHNLLNGGGRVAGVLFGAVEVGAAVEHEVGDAVARVEVVVAGFTEESVLSRAADERVVAGVAVDRVVAAAAVDEVGGGASHNGVVAVAADEVLVVGA